MYYLYATDALLLVEHKKIIGLNLAVEKWLFGYGRVYVWL